MKFKETWSRSDCGHKVRTWRFLFWKYHTVAFRHVQVNEGRMYIDFESPFYSINIAFWGDNLPLYSLEIMCGGWGQV